MLINRSYGRYFKIPKYMLLLILIIYLNNDSTFHFITNNGENKTINVLLQAFCICLPCYIVPICISVKVINFGS